MKFPSRKKALLVSILLAFATSTFATIGFLKGEQESGCIKPLKLRNKKRIRNWAEFFGNKWDKPL